MSAARNLVRRLFIFALVGAVFVSAFEIYDRLYDSVFTGEREYYWDNGVFSGYFDGHWEDDVPQHGTLSFAEENEVGATFSIRTLYSSDGLPSFQVGDIIEFGREGLGWHILDIQDDKIFLLSEIILQLGPFHSTAEDITWEYSDLRAYLNGEFLETYFSFDEEDRIVWTEVINNPNPWFETSNGNDTTDRVFLLSVEEVVRYFGDSGQLDNRPEDATAIDDEFNQNRIARDRAGRVQNFWGLRTMGKNQQRTASIWNWRYESGEWIDWGGISMHGNMDTQDDDGNWVELESPITTANYGVRPAMWVYLSYTLFSLENAVSFTGEFEDGIPLVGMMQFANGDAFEGSFFADGTPASGEIIFAQTGLSIQVSGGNRVGG